tara:strand:+ start:109 stop:588 length:480 start_codon:yes stop_codon:yes gene_type:complete
MSLLDKEPVQRVQKLLMNFDINQKIINLDNSARTAKEAASSLGCETGAIVKSLLFRAENTFVLCLMSGDKKVSLNKLKKILNIKDVSMASADEVKKITGFTIGGVSPIGHLNNINVIMDSSLERHKELYAAAGHPNCVFKISFRNLAELTNGSVKDIAE